jgi:hypothetical protein
VCRRASTKTSASAERRCEKDGDDDHRATAVPAMSSLRFTGTSLERQRVVPFTHASLNQHSSDECQE